MEGNWSNRNVPIANAIDLTVAYPGLLHGGGLLIHIYIWNSRIYIYKYMTLLKVTMECPRWNFMIFVIILGGGGGGLRPPIGYATTVLYWLARNSLLNITFLIITLLGRYDWLIGNIQGRYLLVCELLILNNTPEYVEMKTFSLTKTGYYMGALPSFLVMFVHKTKFLSFILD